MRLLLCLVSWVALVWRTPAIEVLESSGGIERLNFHGRSAKILHECEAANLTSYHQNRSLELVEPFSGLIPLTVETFAEAVGVPGHLSLVALYCGTGDHEMQEDGRSWKDDLMDDLSGTLRLPAGQDLHVADLDVCNENMMQLLIPSWQRGIFKATTGNVLHALVLQAPHQEKDNGQRSGSPTTPVVMSRHTGRWGQIRTRVIHRIERAFASGGRLVADIETERDLIALNVPTGHMIVLLTCGKDVERSTVHASLEPVIAHWAELGLVRDQKDGAGDGSLPIFAVMQDDENWSAAASGGQVRVQVLYSAVAPLSPAVTWELTLQELPTQLQGLLKEWGTTPIIDSSFGDAFLTDIISIGLFPDDVRYACVVPCASFDFNPWPMARLDSRTLKCALSPLLPLLIASRNTVHTFCAPLSLLQTATFTRRNDEAAEMKMESQSPKGTVGAVIFDSRNDFYTGQERMVVYVADAAGPDWSNRRHLQIFNDSKEHMLEGDKLVRRRYRSLAMENLDQSVEAFVDWFERTAKEEGQEAADGPVTAEDGTRTFDSDFVRSVYFFMERTEMDMEDRLLIANYFEEHPQHELGERQLTERPEEDLIFLWPKDSVDSGDEEVHTTGSAPGVEQVASHLSDAISRRDDLCSAVKRAELALDQVLKEMQRDSDMRPKDYAPLAAVLKTPMQCQTTSGFTNETQVLSAMREHGPLVIGKIARALQNNLKSLVRNGKELLADEDGEDDDDDEWHRISLMRAYEGLLSEVHQLTDRLTKLKSIANEAARTHTKMRFKTFQYNANDPWPVAARVKPVLRYDVSTLSLEEFGRHATEGQPLILTGFNMTKGGLWTPEVLKEKCGRLLLDAGEVVKRHKRSRKWGGIVPGTVTTVTLAEYIDSHLDKLKNGDAAGQTDDAPTYLLDVSLQQRCGSIFGQPPFADLSLPPHLATNYYEYGTDGEAFAAHWPSVFCGPKGTGTGMHEDNALTEFFMMLTSGQKHWRMFKPEHRFLVYHDLEYHTFTADAFKPDLDTFPLLAYADVYETKQNAGELLFIPSGSIHAIHNTGDFSCGFTANYLDAWGMHQSLFYHLVHAGEPALSHHLRYLLSTAAPEPLDSRPTSVAGEGPLVTKMLRAWVDWGHAGRELSASRPVPFGVYRSGRL